MKSHTPLLAVALAALAACASTHATPAKDTHAMSTDTKAAHTPGSLQIKVTTIYVDDQDKALRFYTDVLGFVKKTDVSNGGFRWLTVAPADEPDGTQLQLALGDSPTAKAYQQAMFAQRQPAIMFNTDDVQAAYDRMKAAGAEFTMPPTDVTGARIAQLEDTCGNLVQVTQLRW
jgi:predicted enzyme related to lactoylglutathione lyase